ncbi:MAG: DUF4097 family beta strand repeat protein [Butyrivibrio sp.]|nr:DUF4097 family beta strand repeat protein [Butyrivibrio sp.]
MNKKVLLIAAGVMIVSGIALMVKAKSMGASGNIVIFGNAKEYSGEKTEGTADISEFDTLTIDAESVGVYLEEGDEYKFEYCTYEGNIPEVTQDGKSLTIKEPEKKDGFVFEIGVFEFDMDNQYYKITVPKDIGPLNVDIKNHSEIIKIEGVDINGTVRTDSDGVIISDCSSDNLDVKSIYDYVKLDNVKLGTVNIDADDEIIINIDGGNDYSFDLTASFDDDIIVENTAMTEGSFKMNNASGKSITAKSHSGDINISFSEE